MRMSVILNLIWFILGGFAAGCAWLLAALILGITIVGLPWAMAVGRIGLFSFFPVALQHFKLASIAMAPVGKTVVPA